MIKEERIRTLFAELVAIDSPSFFEREMADVLKEKFAAIGVLLTEDGSGAVTGSNAGNLFGRIPADLPEGRQEDLPPVLLAAHMDTVNPAKGKKAVFHPDGTVTSDGTTVLGADDLAGVTAIYEAVRHIKEEHLPHREIEILLSTGEELYCKGANAFDYSQIHAKEAYVLDLSGDVGGAAYAAPTLFSFQAKIQGKASHAGFRPEDGINSIRAAVKAAAKLPQGRIDAETTANIGQILGGTGTNIVPELCVVSGEIRSLHHEKAVQLLQSYREAFAEEAKKEQAELVWEETLNIHAYETSLTGDAAEHYKKAVEKEGLCVRFEKTFGGSDNNVFAEHGIEGLVIATSMHEVHSCREYTRIPEQAAVARIVANLVTV